MCQGGWAVWGGKRVRSARGTGESLGWWNRVRGGGLLKFSVFVEMSTCVNVSKFMQY